MSWIDWSKFFALLVMPVGLIWSALLLMAARALWRRRRRAALGLLVLWGALGAAGNPYLGQMMIVSLQEDYRAIDPLREGPFDAVLVLGGGVREPLSGVRRAQLAASGDRAALGAELILAGRTPTLVASGTSPWSTGSHVDATTSHWVALGVPREQIMTLPDATITRQELEALAQQIERHGWQQVGVVSSGWHLRRVEAHVARLGLEESVQLLPADLYPAPRWEGLRTLVPQGQGFLLVQRACWELLGAAVGR